MTARHLYAIRGAMTDDELIAVSDLEALMGHWITGYPKRAEDRRYARTLFLEEAATTAQDRLVNAALSRDPSALDSFDARELAILRQQKRVWVNRRVWPQPIPLVVLRPQHAEDWRPPAGEVIVVSPQTPFSVVRSLILLGFLASVEQVHAASRVVDPTN